MKELISVCAWCFPGESIFDVRPELRGCFTISHSICAAHSRAMLGCDCPAQTGREAAPAENGAVFSRENAQLLTPGSCRSPETVGDDPDHTKQLARTFSPDASDGPLPNVQSGPPAGTFINEGVMNSPDSRRDSNQAHRRVYRVTVWPKGGFEIKQVGKES